MAVNRTLAGPGTAGDVRSEVFNRYADYFDRSPHDVQQKLADFAKYVPREALLRFLVRYEIFKRVLHVQGSIVECGVLGGGGLMAFAQISEGLEPLNHQRKIVGFDTFAGFPSVSDKDTASSSVDECKPGGLCLDSYGDLKRSVEIWNSLRYLRHVPKLTLVQGDICHTVPMFLEQNPHFLVSLLYLDADLYEPTKAAISNFLPRMPRGAVIAFDELNDQYWPGETLAALDSIGIRSLRLERLFATSVSFAVLE